MATAVYVIATLDTKGAEAAYVVACLQVAGIPTILVDVSTHEEPSVKADRTRQEVLASIHSTVADLPTDRGQAIEVMANALGADLQAACRRGEVLGVVGIGGSGGTSLITAAMRRLKIGLPKLMVSTMASGNTAPYVDCSDITMMSSVVDVAGLNRVSRRIFSNAAHAMAGMVTHQVPPSQEQPTLGMTMFGVTTPCVTAARKLLETAGFECLVFHATGTGGRAMEQLVASKLLQGILDITTTELADLIVGGVLPATEQRFDAMLERKIPWVLSLGALDMVNFGSRDSVPTRFSDRTFHVHNAEVTLMRTNAEENAAFGRWIASKLNRATSPVTMVIPTQGVSMLDAPGQPFYDPIADRALIDALTTNLRQDRIRKVVCLDHHINDPEFSQRVVDEFMQLNVQSNGGEQTPAFGFN